MVGEKGKHRNQDGQPTRICKLRKDGMLDELASLEMKPIVYCHKCKAQSNDPSTLCNPRALKQKKAA